MVTVDEIGKVRRAYWVQGKKIKAIARETGLSRGTVRRIVRSGETVLTYERREQPLPKLGQELIDRLRHGAWKSRRSQFQALASLSPGTTWPQASISRNGDR